MKKIFIVLILFISTYAQTIVNGNFGNFAPEVLDSTKGLWIFDSKYHGSTAIYTDLSGEGNNLTASAGFNYTSQLYPNSPIYDGGYTVRMKYDDYWYIPSPASTFNPGDGDVTIEFWFKTDSIGFQKLWSKYAAIDSRYLIQIRSDGTIGYYEHFGTLEHDVYGTTVVADSDWHYLALIIRNDSIFIYLDGVKEALNTEDLTLITNRVVNGPVEIGRYNYGHYFNGYMAAVRYSSRALTEQEIKDTYHKARNWFYSGSLSVFRNNYGFYQGITNTSESAALQTSFSINESAEYILWVKAKRRSGSGNLVVKINNDQTIAGGSHSLKSVWEKFFIPLGYLNAEIDTLSIYSTNTSDSILVDDITLQKRRVILPHGWIGWRR